MAQEGQGLDPSKILELITSFVSLPDEETLRSLLAESGNSPECRTCPVCQGLRRLRDTDPAIVEELSTVATRVMRGFMSAVEAAGSRRSAAAEVDEASAKMHEPPSMQDTSDESQ